MTDTNISAVIKELKSRGFNSKGLGKGSCKVYRKEDESLKIIFNPFMVIIKSEEMDLEVRQEFLQGIDVGEDKVTVRFGNCSYEFAYPGNEYSVSIAN